MDSINYLTLFEDLKKPASKVGMRIFNDKYYTDMKYSKEGIDLLVFEDCKRKNISTIVVDFFYNFDFNYDDCSRNKRIDKEKPGFCICVDSLNNKIFFFTSKYTDEFYKITFEQFFNTIELEPKKTFIFHLDLLKSLEVT